MYVGATESHIAELTVKEVEKSNTSKLICADRTTEGYCQRAILLQSVITTYMISLLTLQICHGRFLAIKHRIFQRPSHFTRQKKSESTDYCVISRVSARGPCRPTAHELVLPPKKVFKKNNPNLATVLQP